MARALYVDGVDDMLADAEKLDAQEMGTVNQVQSDMIQMLFHDHDFSAEDIADHLGLRFDQVQEILVSKGQS